MTWQKRLRVGVAIFGLVFAGFVYRSIGERQGVAPPAPVDRVDPKAMLETTSAELVQERGSEREFRIKSGRTLTYDDGSARHSNVEITIPRPGGQFIVITAQEAIAGANEVELQLQGSVKLAASDGFQLTTDRGTFNRSESIARAPGEISFSKGRMSGSGRGGTYDQQGDVLNIAERARVIVSDDAGQTTLDMTAGVVTLDRTHDVLFFESKVHVLREGQTITADHGMGRLSANEDVVTYLELRGDARVQGGAGPIESMKANAIDLDYADDGELLERVVLNGSASLSTAADEGVSARNISGEGLDVQMAADGSVATVAGRDGVRLDLPAAAGTPPRSVEARTLDATGEPGRGLNAVVFRQDVVFREGGESGAVTREARAQSLNASLDGEGISDARFRGAVTFTEGSLRAEAADARYRPASNLLNLSGGDAGRSPIVTDEQIRVEARTIDVTLDGHGMRATGNVRTLLSGRSAAGRGGNDGRLPGLLREGQAASVNAEKLDYSGGRGRAEYSGNATLVQGDTAIRGDLIGLDREKGDLVASGSARSTLMLGQGRTEGRADEIRYDEAARTVTYSTRKVAPTSQQEGDQGRAAGEEAARLAQVSGPDGDLRAERIEVVLARNDNAVERLEAYTRVTMIVGARTAVGGRLTYHATDERYVMSTSGVTPVVIREACRETTGRTLTFFKSTDRIVVDGNDTRRVETRPCTTQPLGDLRAR